MSLRDLFKSRRKTGSATVAKERLQILVAHERQDSDRRPPYMEQLQRDILQVVRKYVQIEQKDIHMEVEHDGNRALLELNIELPSKR